MSEPVPSLSEWCWLPFYGSSHGGALRGAFRLLHELSVRTLGIFRRRCWHSHSQALARAVRDRRVRSRSQPEGVRRRALNSGAAALVHSIRGWPARIGAEIGALVAFTGAGAGWRPLSQSFARAASKAFRRWRQLGSGRVWAIQPASRWNHGARTLKPKAAGGAGG